MHVDGHRARAAGIRTDIQVGEGCRRDRIDETAAIDDAERTRPFSTDEQRAAHGHGCRVDQDIARRTGA